MLEAIIFDMDGVIVDTEYVDFQLQSQMIRSIAKNPERLTHADFSSLVGRSYGDLVEAIKDLSQTDLSLEEIEERLEQVAEQKYFQMDYATLFRKDMIQILDFAKERGIKLAVASSSRKAHILEVLQACGIESYFDLVVSGEDFEESKPNPAIYQAVLESLGVAADQALAIEDSTYGILAAKRAGLTVLAYEEKRMLVDQSLADYQGRDMLEIFKLIQIQYTNKNNSLALPS